MNKKTLIAAVTLVLGMATLFVGCEADAFHSNTQDESAGLIKDVEVDEPNVELPSSSSTSETGYCVFLSGTCLPYTEDNCDNANGDFVSKCPSVSMSSSSAEEASSSSSSDVGSSYVNCEYYSNYEGTTVCEPITSAMCTYFDGKELAVCPSTL